MDVAGLGQLKCGVQEKFWIGFQTIDHGTQEILAALGKTKLRCRSFLPQTDPSDATSIDISTSLSYLPTSTEPSRVCQR